MNDTAQLITDYAGVWTATTSNIIQLWAMYAAGNFAACAFSITVKTLHNPEKWAMTIGYWLFATGILALIGQQLELLLRMSKQIPEEAQYWIAPILMELTHPKWISVTFHLLVGLCVTAIIWRSSFAKKAA